MFGRKRKSDSDAELIKGLRSPGISFEKAATALFAQYQGYVFRMLKKYPALGEEEIHDAYADAIDATIRKVIRQEFDEQKGKLSTLLFQIFSNKCIDRIRHNTNHKAEWEKELAEITPDLPVASQDFLRSVMAEEAFRGVESLMEDLHPPCKELILAFDYWGYRPDEVAGQLGYKNGKTASQAKYKCMEKLRKMIAAKQIQFPNT